MYADMAWGTDFQIQLLMDVTRSPHRENHILEQLVKAQEPSTLLGFKKATDKLMNDFGRYSQSNFSNTSFPICPLSSSFSPDLAIPDHPSIIQLVETLSLYLNPSAHQLIQFSQIAHLWPVLINDKIVMLQPSGKTLLSCYKISANMKFLLDPVLRATRSGN